MKKPRLPRKKKKELKKKGISVKTYLQVQFTAYIFYRFACAIGRVKLQMIKLEKAYLSIKSKK